MSVWRFDDREGAVDELFFELQGDDTEADWNLGRDGAFWLAGIVSGGLKPGMVEVDMRSLDETIAALTGVSKTFYPLDQSQLSYPMEIVEVSGDQVRVRVDLELDWDHGGSKPADYGTHRFSLEAEARIVRS